MHIHASIGSNDATKQIPDEQKGKLFSRMVFFLYSGRLNTKISAPDLDTANNAAAEQMMKNLDAGLPFWALACMVLTTLLT